MVDTLVSVSWSLLDEHLVGAGGIRRGALWLSLEGGVELEDTGSLEDQGGCLQIRCYGWIRRKDKWPWAKSIYPWPLKTDSHWHVVVIPRHILACPRGARGEGTSPARRKHRSPYNWTSSSGGAQADYLCYRVCLEPGRGLVCQQKPDRLRDSRWPRSPGAGCPSMTP